MTAVLDPSALEGIEALSFDLDGTLYELPALRRAVRNLALRRCLRPLRTYRELRSLLRDRAEFQRAREAGGELAPFPGLGERFASRSELEERWWLPGIASVGPRAGVPELLDAAAARGLRLVVCSDHAGEEKLEALGLGHFERAFSGEALGAIKPDPRVLEAALEHLGLEPSQLLHVGDRQDTDGEAARALGVPCWIVPPEGRLSLGSRA